MYLLVPAHPGCPGQSQKSHKTVVCVCVCFKNVIFHEIEVALHDAMLARYMPSLCVHVCGVNVAYWRLSDCNSSAVGIAQLAHAASSSILCYERWQCGSFQMTLGRTCFQTYTSVCSILLRPIVHACHGFAVKSSAQ